ncbi:hypothetical protein [Arthrobacter roseus]|uniref:hypothetical protein n=1 Tax=Arthrobacter roseus TaxID=136274 RepID=UPI0019659BC9|nr:hypothetical protein [Arthrobacter roseus]MBM7849068.1 uncharacterized SAM-binding protein YcdF (DUF218 family) [Arthrobacter roseus]
MSSVFWEVSPDEEIEDVPPVRPLGVTIMVAVDLLLLLLIIPAGMLSLFPFAFLIYIYLAQILVWLSPVLIVPNLLAFLWGFRRKRAAVTALTALAIAFTGVSVIVVLLWQAPIVILGVNFG